jgi:hypothetical protein
MVVQTLIHQTEIWVVKVDLVPLVVVAVHKVDLTMVTEEQDLPILAVAVVLVVDQMVVVYMVQVVVDLVDTVIL